MTPKEAYFRCLHENCRISKLENVIALDPDYSYLYALNLIKDRWEEGEKIIATDPPCSYIYARDVIKGTFEDGEKSISSDPYYSYLYAHDVLKGRFIEGEKSIATHSEFSYCYARHVLKCPFDLCHPIIFNSKYKELYIKFLKSINYDLSQYGEWLI